LAHVVLPGNRTVLDELGPIIATAYRSGEHPSLGNSVPSLPAVGPRFSTDSAAGAKARVQTDTACAPVGAD
jgi:hypothetical protein